MSSELLKQKRKVSKPIRSNNSNCRVIKQYTEDEIEFVLSKIGMYTIASIAKRLNRSRDSVVGVLKYRNILSFQERYKNGITPFALSREWQISHSNISYWIRHFDLPLILPDKNQKLGMAGQKPVRIINESMLVDWWKKGYALINEIDPISMEKKRKLNEIRQHMYKHWIPTNAIADALYVTHNGSRFAAARAPRWLRTGCRLAVKAYTAGVCFHFLFRCFGEPFRLLPLYAMY
jgi:hypothetical protein